MNDDRDIVDKLLFPAAHADRRRLMREAGDLIACLRADLDDANIEIRRLIGQSVVDAHKRFKRD